MLKYFVEKCKSIKADYMNSSPRGKWRYVLKLALFVQRLTAVAMVDKFFEVWWFTYADIFLSMLYNIWYYSDTSLKGYLFFSLMSIVVPSMMIYAMVFIPSQRKKFQALIYFAGEKIYPNFRTESSIEYLEICDQSAIKLLLNTLQIVGMIQISTGVLTSFSLLAFVLDNEIQLSLPILFPFTDLESISGLVINMLNQGFVGFLGIVGNIGIEIPTCMLKNSVWVMRATISHAIDELTEKIEAPEKYSKSCIDRYFRNIVARAQDMDRFIIKMCKLFYWRILWQPILLAFGISMALFFYLAGVWRGGLGVAFLSYTQLFIQCDFGNDIKSANDMLVVKLKEMPWYLMSNESQMAYARVIQRLQNGASLRMGPFAELNFETLSNMTKRIYSFVMMLLKMLN